MKKLILLTLLLAAAPFSASADEQLIKKSERLELPSTFRLGLNRYVDYETGNILYIYLSQDNSVEMVVVPNQAQTIQQLENNRGPLSNGRQR